MPFKGKYLFTLKIVIGTQILDQIGHGKYLKCNIWYNSEINFQDRLTKQKNLLFKLRKLGILEL